MNITNNFHSDSQRLLCRQRIIPGEGQVAVNRPIRDDSVLGYYFCECEGGDSYGVDHDAMEGWIRREIGDRRPLLVLIIRRILVSHMDVEAGVRCDLYLQKDTFSLLPLQMRIVDTAYMSAKSLQNIIEGHLVDYNEVKNHRNNLTSRNVNVELEYDVALSELLRDAQQRTRNLLWNAKCRLAADRTHLKGLIKNRMAGLERLWLGQRATVAAATTATTTTVADHSSMVVESEQSNTPQRVAVLLNQLVVKELPHANVDSLRRLPMTSHVAFYDRPSIAMKMPRGASGSNGLTKKRRSSNGMNAAASSKGPPRPILPATNGLSRTPSIESLPSPPPSAPVAEIELQVVRSGSTNTESLLLSTTAESKAEAPIPTSLAHQPSAIV
jgi:hypothetical protein